jgi:hypothetical protein
VYYANTREDAAQIGFDDAFIYEELTRAISGRKIPMVQIMRAEARAVFEEWQKKSDRIRY